MIIFETERLIVRQYNHEDVDNFFALNGDPEVMRYIRNPQSKDEATRFLEENIQAYLENPHMGRWAVIEKSTGEFAGTFVTIPLDHYNEPQVGYALLKPFWGKGYASELTKRGVKNAFEKLSFSKLLAVAEEPNTASHKVLEKNDFTVLSYYADKGRSMRLYELPRPFMLQTGRLNIIPLSLRQLKLYLQAEGHWEKEMNLRVNGRVVAKDVKEMVEKGVLTTMSSLPAAQQLFHTFWIVVDRSSETIVAELGCKGIPNGEGEVEIGYGTMPGFTGLGYMTEAVQGLINWTREHAAITAVLAEINQNNIPSIRVVEKNGFEMFDRKDELLWWKKRVKP